MNRPSFVIRQIPDPLSLCVLSCVIRYLCTFYHQHCDLRTDGSREDFAQSEGQVELALVKNVRSLLWLDPDSLPGHKPPTERIFDARRLRKTTVVLGKPHSMHHVDTHVATCTCCGNFAQCVTLLVGKMLSTFCSTVGNSVSR